MIRIAVVVAALLVVPSPALAWGFDAHKLIADRMIALLSELFSAFFFDRVFFMV
jgi:hypothetical protein